MLIVINILLSETVFNDSAGCWFLFKKSGRIVHVCSNKIAFLKEYIKLSNKVWPLIKFRNSTKKWPECAQFNIEHTPDHDYHAIIFSF